MSEGLRESGAVREGVKADGSRGRKEESSHYSPAQPSASTLHPAAKVYTATCFQSFNFCTQSVSFCSLIRFCLALVGGGGIVGWRDRRVERERERDERERD